MATYKLQVSPTTLAHIENIKSTEKVSARDAVEKAIEQYWLEVSVQKVEPKPEYINEVELVTGSKGPFKVEHQQNSATGLSDGMYKLDSCPVPISKRWLKKSVEKKYCSVSYKYSFVVTLFLLILQSLIILL